MDDVCFFSYYSYIQLLSLVDNIENSLRQKWLKSMKNIDSITDIGGIDADNDALLMRCFQNHKSYNSIRKFEKFIVLGRKGTGKTAIFKKFK